MGAFLARAGNRHEVGTAPSPFGDLVGDAIIIELEMALRLLERGVEDRIFDDDLCHVTPGFSVWTGAE
ncbi:MAG: hypothetical protein KAX65_13185, partial [Caldilineaceae bacterium]|nr:hypothetical protein [Caldilineaceae bacterium]